MEMICDILDVLSPGPAKPTHILYKANMSWKVLTAHLEFLTAKGMVQKENEDGGKRCVYRLTRDGRSILQLYVGLKVCLAQGLSKESSEELSRLAGTLSATPLRTSASRW